MFFAVVFIHKADSLDVVAGGNLVEPHNVGGEHQQALIASVQDRMVSEEVLDDVIASLQANPASDLAPFGGVSVFLGVEKREKVHLPSHLAALLNNLLLLLKFDSIVHLGPVHFELFFGLEGFSALGTRHLEGCLELDVLVRIDLHLSSMVLAVLLFSDLVFQGFAMLF